MSLLFLTCLFPFIGFLLLAFSAGRFSENKAALVGVGSIGLSALTTLFVGMQFLQQGTATVFNQTLWQWINTVDLKVGLVLHLDGLSLTMLGVVTGVGFLIHLLLPGICAVRKVIPASLLIPICSLPACCFWCWPIT